MATNNKKWFTKARIGMFIHFGLYSLLARKSEWVMLEERIARAEYEKLMDKLTLPKFSAEEWVDSAKSMGAKYICITAKHHDGFCLWDTQYTDYKITNTPFKRDLLEEIIFAARNSGLNVEIYYSLPDWHHPSYLYTSEPEWPDLREGDKPDWTAYQKYLFNQVEELCSKYGKIDGIWWDMGMTKTPEQWQSQKLYDMIKSYNPETMVNDRSQIPADYKIGERLIGKIKGELFENCESLGAKAWSFIQEETYFSPEAITVNIAKTLQANGNFLLNVGPNGEGEIEEQCKTRLKIIGNWVKENINVYSNSKPIPLVCNYFKRRENNSLADVRINHNENIIYLIVYERPIMDSFIIHGLKSLPETGEIKITGEKLQARQCSENLGIEIKGFPFAYQDTFPAIIQLSFKEAPVFAEKVANAFIPHVITVNSLKPTLLSAGTARVIGIEGATPPLIKNFPDEAISTGWWSMLKQFITWDIKLKAAGVYDLDVKYELLKCNLGAEYTINLAGNFLFGIIGEGTLMDNIYTRRFSNIKLPEGLSCVTLQPQKISKTGGFADIKSLLLIPKQRGAV